MAIKDVSDIAEWEKAIVKRWARVVTELLEDGDSDVIRLAHTVEQFVRPYRTTYTWAPGITYPPNLPETFNSTSGPKES